jgi:hypothetical protein
MSDSTNAAAPGALARKWLFAATFVSMLALAPVFGWLCAQPRRARVLPADEACFAVNLAGSGLALKEGLAFLAVPVAAVWFALGIWLGCRLAEGVAKPG